MRLAVKIFSVSMVFAGVAYLFLGPVQTYLGERSQVALQERTIAVLGAEDAKLASEKVGLQRPATIERLARKDYGLVMPGQKAYAVLPSTSPAPVVHAPAPKPKSSPWYAPLEFWHHF